MRYGALLLAIGARPAEAVTGALTFRRPADVQAFGGLLRELERGRVRSVAFAVHPAVSFTDVAFEGEARFDGRISRST